VQRYYFIKNNINKHWLEEILQMTFKNENKIRTVYLAITDTIQFSFGKALLAFYRMQESRLPKISGTVVASETESMRYLDWHSTILKAYYLSVLTSEFTSSLTRICYYVQFKSRLNIFNYLITYKNFGFQQFLTQLQLSQNRCVQQTNILIAFTKPIGTQTWMPYQKSRSSVWFAGGFGPPAMVKHIL
uniref:Uncharacterized protein n=1 Tax=Echinococcus canadensis TaxID=519352 RepID=A0A915EWF7_9CEST